MKLCSKFYFFYLFLELQGGPEFRNFLSHNFGTKKHAFVQVVCMNTNVTCFSSLDLSAAFVDLISECRRLNDVGLSGGIPTAIGGLEKLEIL